MIGQPVMDAIAEIFARSNRGQPGQADDESRRKAKDVNKWKPNDFDNVKSVLLCKSKLLLKKSKNLFTQFSIMKIMKILNDLSINSHLACKVRRKVNGMDRDQTVKGIHRLPAGQIEFRDSHGRKTTVLDYFTKTLRARINHANGPVIQLGATSFVPAEVIMIFSRLIIT